MCCPPHFFALLSCPNPLSMCHPTFVPISPRKISPPWPRLFFPPSNFFHLFIPISSSSSLHGIVLSTSERPVLFFLPRKSVAYPCCKGPPLLFHPFKTPQQLFLPPSNGFFRAPWLPRDSFSRSSKCCTVHSSLLVLPAPCPIVRKNLYKRSHPPPPPGSEPPNTPPFSCCLFLPFPRLAIRPINSTTFPSVVDGQFPFLFLCFLARYVSSVHRPLLSFGVSLFPLFPLCRPRYPSPSPPVLFRPWCSPTPPYGNCFLLFLSTPFISRFS